MIPAFLPKNVGPEKVVRNLSGSLWLETLHFSIRSKRSFRVINRGSYILLNKLGKRGKMRGLPSVLSLFRNEFNKFNNTRARMLDSIYHMTLRFL